MKFIKSCKLFLISLFKKVYFIHYTVNTNNVSIDKVETFDSFVDFYTRYKYIISNERFRNIYIVFK